MKIALNQLARLARLKHPRGVTSVCAAHPLVLRAAIRFGKQHKSTILIEATCNQVNHLGGYTGMTPHDFARLVADIAKQEACPRTLIVLGGDHLGPNPWRDRPAGEAMAEAEKMVAAYVAAGFRKIHLDCSMGCKGEPAALDDETTARRAVRLASVAEATAKSIRAAPPLYVIGTEVPVPGGANHVIDTLEPTSPAAARKTLAVHRRVFAEAGLDSAFARAIALVVQPGVEFGNHNVIRYDRKQARSLVKLLKTEKQFVFEAHSSDYQGELSLRQLVEDGFSILKVGPALTFALREALYALDHMASQLIDGYGDRPLFKAMEAAMLAKPKDWSGHYHGSKHEQAMLRHFSLSDRIRYYWGAPEAAKAALRLFEKLKGKSVPLPLMSQYLPQHVDYADKPLNIDDIVIAHITRVLDEYHKACA